MLRADQAAQLAGADTGLVALQQGPEALVVEVAVGPDADALVGRALHDGPGSAAAAARASGTAVALEPADAPHELVPGCPVGSAVVVPLGSGGVRGVLVVAAPVGGEPVLLRGGDELGTFAGQAALALELAERRRDAERLSVFEDRDRIARDLHDVAASHLSALVVHNKLARRVDTPAALGEAADFTARTTAEALAAMRQVVHVLSTDLDPPRGPQPGLDELDRVIAAIEALPGVLQAFWNAGTEE